MNYDLTINGIEFKGEGIRMDMLNKIDTIGFANRAKEEIRADVDTLAFTPEYICYLIKDEDGNVDKASEKYVSLKHKTSEECGVSCEVKILNASEFGLEMIMANMNKQPIRAILQLPAPETCVEMFSIAVKNGVIIDVDHLGDDVLTDMWTGNFDRIPATPRGAVALLCEELGSLSGKKICIIGSRSKTVGRFLIPMLQHLNATVSMYHSRSIINESEFANYDAIISCVGVAKLIKEEHIGKGQVLIDIGVSFDNGKVSGDFSECCRKDNRWTPYTNGMGLLTRVFLVANVVESYIIGGIR